MKIGQAKVIADAAKLSEEDWQELRHKSIGSSDAAAVLSMGRYGSPYQVWEVKTGKRTIEQNFKMQLGHAMEPVVLELAAEELGMDIAKPDLVLAHPDHPELTCNLDGYATNVYGDEAIVEAKHAGNYLKGELKRWADSGGPDEDSATEGWWVRDADVVTRKFPKSYEEDVVDMGSVMDDVVMARQFKDRIKSLKKELAEHDVRIKAHLGEGGSGVHDGEKIISSYTMERKSVDYHKLFMEHPEVYAAVVSTKVSRMYRY